MKVELIKRERNGKVSLWAEAPNKNAYDYDRWNIWDLDPKEATPDVLNAILSAFNLGAMFQRVAFRSGHLEIPPVFKENK
jgi:hypothetical protein